MNITATSKIAVSKTVVTELTVLPEATVVAEINGWRHRPTGGARYHVSPRRISRTCARPGSSGLSVISRPSSQESITWASSRG